MAPCIAYMLAPLLLENIQVTYQRTAWVGREPHGYTYPIKAHSTKVFYFSGVFWTRNWCSSIHMCPKSSCLFKHFWILFVLYKRKRGENGKLSQLNGPTKEHDDAAGSIPNSLCNIFNTISTLFHADPTQVFETIRGGERYM